MSIKFISPTDIKIFSIAKAIPHEKTATNHWLVKSACLVGKIGIPIIPEIINVTEPALGGCHDFS